MIISAISLCISLYATYWIYNDTRKCGFESSKCFMWAVFTLFFWYFALPIYFLVGRGSRTLPKQSYSFDNYSHSEPRGETVDVSEKVTCPNCKKQVPSSFSHCQHCGYTMKPQCSGCGKNLEPEWTVCPHCGTKVEEEKAVENDETQE